MRRILVTRPEPGASATATRLVAMGFSPVVMPLTRIVPMPPQPAGACDAVTVTSANALRHVAADFLAPLLGTRLFAVGATTAKAASQAGFRDIAVADGTAESLAALIGQAMPAGGRILHLAGRERTAGFEEELSRLGFSIEIVETYRADVIAYAPEFLARVPGDAPLWGALAYSERGGSLLAALSQRDEIRERFEETRFFCISAKVAAALPGRRVLVAETPTEEAVLALLSSQG